MSHSDIELWAQRFVSDLAPGGLQVPLRRAMKRHLTAIRHLRSLGLTWKAIAQCIDRAAVDVPGYRPVAADLLRSNFARLDKTHPAVPMMDPLDTGKQNRSSLVTTLKLVGSRYEKT